MLAGRARMQETLDVRDPWVATIAVALSDLGGAAHQDALLMHIKRQQGVSALSHGDWNAFVGALASHEREADPYFSRGGDAFGRRWSLTGRGLSLFGLD